MESKKEMLIKKSESCQKLEEGTKTRWHLEEEQNSITISGWCCILCCLIAFIMLAILVFYTGIYCGYNKCTEI